MQNRKTIRLSSLRKVKNSIVYKLNFKRNDKEKK